MLFLSLCTFVHWEPLKSMTLFSPSLKTAVIPQGQQYYPFQEKDDARFLHQMFWIVCSVALMNGLDMESGGNYIWREARGEYHSALLRRVYRDEKCYTWIMVATPFLRA